MEYEYEWNTDFSIEVLLCGWKIKSIVAYVGNNECEGCWWADKVPWDTSQAPRDLATEHLGKCGQTDESRLGALPPKGRVTFSGDNMGLQWHRKHPPSSSTLHFCGPSSFFHLSILSYFSLCFPFSANFPDPECCSNCLPPFHSVTGQKIWLSSKSLVALHQGAKWMKMWLGSTKKNDYWQKRHTMPEQYDVFRKFCM